MVHVTQIILVGLPKHMYIHSRLVLPNPIRVEVSKPKRAALEMKRGAVLYLYWFLI